LYTYIPYANDEAVNYLNKRYKEWFSEDHVDIRFANSDILYDTKMLRHFLTSNLTDIIEIDTLMLGNIVDLIDEWYIDDL
jgi:hypothetical protein